MVHGLRYVFPARWGGEARGLPTAWAASPLADESRSRAMFLGLAVPPRASSGHRARAPRSAGSGRGSEGRPAGGAADSGRRDPDRRCARTRPRGGKAEGATAPGRYRPVNLANLEMLELAAVALAELPDKLVFVGGATIELWVTDAAAPEFRPTDDVDVVVEITTRAAYYRFEERLRAIGFANEPRGGVICRFRHRDSGVAVAAMPTEAQILGFENRWQKGGVSACGRSGVALGTHDQCRAARLPARDQARGVSLTRERRSPSGARTSRTRSPLSTAESSLSPKLRAAAPEPRAFIGEAMSALLGHQSVRFRRGGSAARWPGD